MKRSVVLKKSAVLYGILHLISYSLITALSAIFRVYIFYIIGPFLVALYTSNYYAKNTDKAMNTAEKVVFIVLVFTFTLIVNILFSADVIGHLRSSDQININFLFRQLLQLIALLITFGSDDFYEYMKTNDQWWNLKNR